MSEVVGAVPMGQHDVETLGEKDHHSGSISDILTPTGRTTIHVLSEQSVKAIDDQRCEFTNHVGSHGTEEFIAFLDRQGIPFDLFRAQR